MGIADLESELLGLAGHIAAAECRFLRLLAEFDERGGWTGVGVRSCAHWLAWRAGMSLRTATEHLRIARALTNLPRITAAFAAGRISYSKVRAITRVTGSDTALLARIAATAGNAGTSTDATDVDIATADADDDDAECSDDSENRDATVDGAVLETAGVAAEDPTVPGTGAGAGAAAASPGTAAVAAPEVAEQVLMDLALSGTASHVETVVRAVRRRHTPPADITARRFLTWYHDADGSLVVRGRFTPDDGAHLIAAIEARTAAPAPAGHPVGGPPPDLDARALEQEPGPAVDRLAARRADTLLDLVRQHDDTAGRVVARGAAQVVVHLDAGTGTARLADGPEIPAPTAERLACDGRAQILLEDRAANRLYLGRSRRLASPAQIAALTARDSADGGGCRFPGCGRTRHLHAHHIRSWLRGGPTDIDNLILICGYHHRLVHEHGYRIRPRPGGGWDVHRPDGVLVLPGGEPLSGNAEALAEMNTRARLRIDRTSLTPDWYGDRLDPVPILDALLPPRPAPVAA